MHAPIYEKVARICQNFGTMEECLDELVTYKYENRKLRLEFTASHGKTRDQVVFEVNIFQKKPFCEEEHVYHLVWDKKTGKEVGTNSFQRKGHKPWWKDYYSSWEPYWPIDLDDMYNRVRTKCNNPPTELIDEIENYGVDEDALEELDAATKNEVQHVGLGGKGDDV